MVAAKRYIKCPGDTVLRDFYSTDNEEMYMYQLIKLYGGQMAPNPSEYRILFQGNYLAAIWIYA